MRQFIKTVVATEDYQEVKRLGDKYVVHQEPVEDKESGTTACWETMTDAEPDMAVLAEELAAWKSHLADVELRIAKQQKIAEIAAYDMSSAVNSFEIQNNGVKVTDYWIGRDLRTSLEGDVLAAESVGSTYKFDIREMGVTLELDCAKFLAALAVLRRYAYTAYNVTSQHIANVNALTSVVEVEAYDYTEGYPEKLVFDIAELR